MTHKNQQIAPLRNRQFHELPWEGSSVKKPWNYRVTVAIPCLDATEAVSAIVALYRLQSEKPFIILIDTGSSPSELEKLQTLASEDCEVHSLRLNGVLHPSDFPAMAMDLAFSICRTQFLLATHADCFPMSRTVVADVLELCCEKSPVVGYEITERDHSDWPGMVGHTLTMFHIPTMDRISAGWSLRRLLVQFEHPDGRQTQYKINSALSPNWPDTELLINYQCRAAGIVPVIVGREKNATRTIDERIDHCRSVASAALYSGGSQYAKKSNDWLSNGIQKAKQRAADWSEVTEKSFAIITIVIAFSGRWSCWSSVRSWLVSQSWPLEKLKILILNSTHRDLTVEDLDLEYLPDGILQIERMDVGRPGLAKLDRRQSVEVAAEVESAVASLYNRAQVLAATNFLFILEDDVFPLRPDAIEQLFKSMNSVTAAVSGLYQHRYQENAVAFPLPFTGQMLPMNGPLTQDVGGTGFGCLLVRKSLLQGFPLSGRSEFPYDVHFAARVKKAGWRWILDRGVKCDHLTQVDEIPAQLPVQETRNTSPAKCQHLGPMVATNLCSCGAQIDIFHCNRQNMNAVRFWIDEERELDRRFNSPAEKVTPTELSQILAVCEKCPLMSFSA